MPMLGFWLAVVAMMGWPIHTPTVTYRMVAETPTEKAYVGPQVAAYSDVWASGNDGMHAIIAAMGEGGGDIVASLNPLHGTRIRYQENIGVFWQLRIMTVPDDVVVAVSGLRGTLPLLWSVADSTFASMPTGEYTWEWSMLHADGSEAYRVHTVVTVDGGGGASYQTRLYNPLDVLIVESAQVPTLADLWAASDAMFAALPVGDYAIALQVESTDARRWLGVVSVLVTVG